VTNDRVIDKLKKVAIFEPLKEDKVALETVAGLMQHKKIAKGHAIIKEGDEGEEMFVLFEGSVEICKNTLAGDRYTVTKLSAEQNAFFGELAMIDNDRRSATVIASSDCDVLVMSKGTFFTLGERDPRVGLTITRKISQILGQRLRRANQDMVTLYEALVGEIEEST
jgi:CRP/FNR family transcriptional regulator, cyclic AMP receptor protein